MLTIDPTNESPPLETLPTPEPVPGPQEESEPEATLTTPTGPEIETTPEPVASPATAADEAPRVHADLASELAQVKARAESMASELEQERQRLARAEQALQEAVRDRELTALLADLPLMTGAITQLVKLLRDEVAVGDGGRLESRDGRPAAAALAEWLAQPDYAHFRRPSSRGGTATPGVTPTGHGRLADSPSSQPRNLGEAAIARWQAIAPQTPGPAAPIGLRRRHGV